MRSPCNGRLHLDFSLLLAEISAAEETGSDPASDYGEEDYDDHDYPFVVCGDPGRSASSSSLRLAGTSLRRNRTI